MQIIKEDRVVKILLLLLFLLVVLIPGKVEDGIARVDTHIDTDTLP